MANLKEIRNRISSVSSTRQITSAMKMVSAAKLRRAQDNIIQLRPYALRLQKILIDISNNLELIADNKYVATRELKRVAIIVIASNKGLCGAFNANVIKTASQILNTQYAELKNNGMVDIITIGKKASEFFTGKGFHVTQTLDDIYDNLTYEEILPHIKNIMKSYLDGYYDKVDMIYNKFKNAAVQELKVRQLMPLAPVDEYCLEKDNGQNFYIYEPSEKEIMTELVPKVIRINFYKALLDSYASEHGARMTAMHKATDNATELIKDLTLQYNKARQAAITNEILEIVGGAEALKG